MRFETSIAMTGVAYVCGFMCDTPQRFVLPTLGYRLARGEAEDAVGILTKV